MKLTKCKKDWVEKAVLAVLRKHGCYEWGNVAIAAKIAQRNNWDMQAAVADADRPFVSGGVASW
ncbi:MAG: hypothetical protein EBR82_10485 [Caulobacteraceae bacterium]|nr:hypothetical protein [Caulobacteraceae bacterium]